MGIYMFNRKTLFELLNQTPRLTDFGREIFPSSIRTHRVHAHLFDGYWEDLGTIKAYHESNLALASDHPPLYFHSQEGIIYTRMRFLPASRIYGAKLEQSLVSDGCVIQAGTQISHSVIGLRKESAIERFLTARHTPFETAQGETVLQGAIVEIDDETGRARGILRIREILPE